MIAQLHCIPYKAGFTLIELSIVLVIIGLVIGGILTGQDLINTATIRSQITQIDKLNTAVRTFQTKYGFLPGDIPNPYATQFGFKTRTNFQGNGNGDGIIVGSTNGIGTGAEVVCESSGETVMLWVDLSTAGLIDQSLSTASSTTPPASDITGAALNNYLPQAKIGGGNYLYVYTGGGWNISTSWYYTGPNYWGLSMASNIAASSNYGKLVSTPGLTVQQAYNIDKKMDDGMPQSGGVVAVYIKNGNGVVWTDGQSITLYGPAPNTGAVQGSATTCMDNNNVAGAKHYSTQINGGGGMNCALSFVFQ